MRIPLQTHDGFRHHSCFVPNVRGLPPKRHELATGSIQKYIDLPLGSLVELCIQANSAYSMTLVTPRARPPISMWCKGKHIAVDLRTPADTLYALPGFLTWFPLSTCMPRVSRGYGSSTARLRSCVRPLHLARSYGTMVLHGYAVDVWVCLII